MGWPIYGVLMVFRSRAEGRPDRSDPRYDPKATLVEERVLVVRARSEKEAEAKVRKSATAWCRSAHTNPYGQKVRTQYLGVVELSEIYDGAAGPGEAFWRTYIAPSTLSDRQLLKQIASRSVRDEEHVRAKFLNRKFIWFRDDG